MQTPCHLGHIGLRLGNIPHYIRFFEDVFGMRVTRTAGPEDAPTSVWLDGGIQLMDETTDDPKAGAVHHICIIVEDVAGTIALAKPYGATSIEGKGAHWFTIPNGPDFELKTH